MNTAISTQLPTLQPLVGGQLNMSSAMPGSGKSMLATHLLYKSGHTVILDLEGVLSNPFSKTQKAPAAHDPAHTPLQKLAEGVRRCVKDFGGCEINTLCRVQAVLLEMGVAGQVMQLRYTQTTPVAFGTRKLKSWEAPGQKLERLERSFLETPLGWMDGRGNSWRTQADLLNATPRPRRIPFSLFPLSAKAMQRYSAAAGSSIWGLIVPMHPQAMLDELELALLEANTPPAHGAGAARRL